MYGAETSDCDSPLSLVNATFEWISENLDGELDFVIWTGDSARHDSDEKIPRTKDQVVGSNTFLANKFAETFVDGMKIPVIPTFGNNDILPHNILHPGPNEWLGEYAKVWGRFIPEEQKHLFEHGGWFYVEAVPKKLAIFSLNTMYFFDRNAAVDDCVRQSEPGFQQMEWLSIQLNQLRKRGMKAILTGHVPPARTDSKQNWYETCWQKYTLWLRQYRDVVVGALYGHMNIDHFFLQDTKNIDFRKMMVEWAETHAEASKDEALSTESNLNIQSTSDYLRDLRSGWSKLPNPASWASVKSLGLDNDDEEGEIEVEAGSKKGKNKGKGNKNLSGKWAERYQVSFVGPSVVPNYFPTLRVFEYDITGLEDQPTWAHALEKSALLSSRSGNLLNLNSTDDDQKEPIFDVLTRNKKKHKKNGHKIPEPNFRVPDPPPKNSLPGPAYSRQPFTLTGYTQYFANLTWINNDMVALGEDPVGPSRWHKGIHNDKDPKTPKARPNEFGFEIEYSTFDDKTYKLKDLTVRNMVKLAYRIGQERKTKDSGKSKTVQMGQDDDEFGGEWCNDDSDSKSDSEADSDQEVMAEAKKRKNHKKHKDKKKHKKRKRSKNEVWLAFLWRALVSTVPKEKLRTFGVEAVLFPEEL